jgi:hypothetical protein
MARNGQDDLRKSQALFRDVLQRKNHMKNLRVSQLKLQLRIRLSLKVH